jgi:hypothetical protein
VNHFTYLERTSVSQRRKNINTHIVLSSIQKPEKGSQSALPTKKRAHDTERDKYYISEETTYIPWKKIRGDI